MIESLSIPISTCLSRARFLVPMLSSLEKHSRRSHEVILATEDDAAKLEALVRPYVGKHNEIGRAHV